MKIKNLLKTIIAPSVNDELAKLDAHLLADIGFNGTHARTTTIRIPVESGVRIV